MDESLPPQSESRRDLLLLGAAAGLLGACASSGARTITAPRRTRVRKPPKDGEPIKMGVIGIGAPSTPAMGFGHCQRICQLAKDGHEKVEIVAIADVAKPYRERGVEHCSKEQGIAVTGYHDYRELLARDDLHGVLIATPEHWHAPMAIAALVAGLDVYVEKPMTYDLEDALRLQAAVHANPEQVFQCGTQFLQHAKYHKAKELIASGAIGKPVFTQTSYCRNSKDGEWLYGIDEKVVPGENLDWRAWCGPRGHHDWNPEVYFRWRRFKQWSSGIVGDLLVHVTTPLVWALDVGWPVRVIANGGHYVDTAMENHDQVLLTVEFERGHTMVIAGSTSNETGLEILVRGHEANLFLGGDACVLRPERIFAENREEQTFPSAPFPAGVGDQDAHRLHWLKCIRTRQKAVGDVDTAAKVMVIVDLATRSMWSGRAYGFDPATLKPHRL
ncbi:MAG: Gfo/Idh/MocA family oxidoreductase [Planctomycetes bacterium]|nr:Gfo/Idh/MocA family oxidoreductase [Planctomycetota bacterium]